VPLRNNLPPHTTAFVGREADAEAIGRLVVESRVVTLTGEPGIGKTRLALHVASQHLAEGADGIWLVDFSPVRDAANVASAVAAVLGLGGGDGRPVREQIVDSLADAGALLILDNCEHVRDAVGVLVASIVQRCSGVRILATSQVALGLAIERTYAVQPLAMPSTAEAAKPPGSLASFDALALFADRARASDDSFVLDDENIADVVRICRYLEGVALAIELTASHVRAADVKLIAADLRSAFGVGGDDTATHAAARSVNWAVAHLAAHEARILRRLTVFSGGWTAISAAAIAADPFEDPRTIDAALAALVEKSLIVVDSAAPGRFRLLESIREHLAPSSTAAERALTAARHARYFADFVAEADRKHYEAPLRTVIGALLPELDNIRTAIAWALGDRNDLDLGCAMVGALGYAWRIVSYHEGERLIALALRAAADPASGVGDRTRARLYRAAAEFEIRLHPAVLDSAKRSIEIYDALRLDVMAAESRRLYGFLLHRNGRTDEGIVELSEAAVTFALAGERLCEGRALSDLAVSVWMNGQRAYANALHARAVEGANAAGDRREASRMGLNFAECQFHTGDGDAAIRTATEAFVRCEGADLQEILASNLAAYFLVQRSAAEAKRYAQLCLDLCRQVAAPVSRPLQHLAGVAALSGPHAYATSLQLLGFVNEQLRVAKERRDRTEQVTYDLTLRLLASAGDAADREAAMAAGSHLTHQEAIALAGSL
jgi:predicted ATPase